MRSFRYFSYLSTVLCFVFTLILFMGESYFRGVLPAGYVWIAPLLIGIATVGNQYVENLRVVRAEDIVHDEYRSEALSNEDISEVLNDEYIAPLTDDEGDVDGGV